MSNRQKLIELRERIAALQRRISADSVELTTLTKTAAILTAKVAVENMPDWQRNVLIHSSMPTNSVPRKPVVRD